MDNSQENKNQEFKLNPFYLSAYYERLFPFETIHKWLSKGCEESFPLREFTFISMSGKYIRYKSFENCKEFRDSVLKKKPLRIEIGPIYNSKPKDKETSLDFEAVKKELVFDIDISDYNDIRTCCAENAICAKCWLLMSCAIKVIDYALREDFGFTNILWTFSGRRGVHCWVSDKRARDLSDKSRFAIGQYFSLFEKKGVRKQASQVFANPHYSVKRAYHFCRLYFLALCESQGWLSDVQSVDKLLSFLPSEQSSFRKSLREKWLGNDVYRDPSWKFKLIEDHLATGKFIKPGSRDRLKGSVVEMVMFFTYPRLDIEVTRKINHLLKSPFVVHPSTGIICVPINTRDGNAEKEYNLLNDSYEEKWAVDDFYNSDLPKLDKVHESINKGDCNENNFQKYLTDFESMVNLFK